MASRRYRSRTSLNSNLADLNSKVSQATKRPNITRVAENSITSVSISEGGVTSDNLAENSITSDKIAPSSVVTTSIANGTVTREKIDPGLFDNLEVDSLTADFAVTTPNLDLYGSGDSFEFDGRIRGNYYPYAMATGSVVITPVASTPSFVTVSVDAGVFSGVPIVIATPNTTVPNLVSSFSISTVTYNVSTQVVTFRVYIIRSNTTNTVVNWTATQMETYEGGGGE